MFTGRSEELKRLNEMHSSGKFEFAIIYGRRRVGKTTLIKEFIKDKKAIYFASREADGPLNLNWFSSDVYSVTSKELAKKAFFSDWEEAFDYIYQVSKEARLVLAIDEYPFLAGSYSPISSILQIHIDNQFKDSKLFLILCGSSMSFMENQVLGYQSPLYGRRTTQLKLRPFTFFESLPFLDSFPREEKAVLYGVTGGVPEYLGKLNPAKSASENIIDMFLTPSGALFEEPSNLLNQELREPGTYNSIIEAIASGASNLNEIAAKCQLKSNKCAKCLSSLMSLGIVKKEFPFDEDTSKKSVYLLEDMMFRFWYRFVLPNLSGVTNGLGRTIFGAEIEDELPAYMGLVFEEICKQYLYEQAKIGALPLLPGKLGRWWGASKEKRQEEIDIVTSRKDIALFCECKWKNALVDVDVLSALAKKAELFQYKETWLWLFSKTGFTERLCNEALNRSHVRLIGFDEMI